MMWDTFSSRGGGLGRTAVELSQLRRTWSAEFIPLPADLHVPRGGGLKSALLNSTAVPPAPPRRGATLAGQFPSWEGSGVGWLALRLMGRVFVAPWSPSCGLPRKGP